MAASWSFTENCHASPTGGALGSTNREEGGLTMRAARCPLCSSAAASWPRKSSTARSTPQQPGTPPGGRKTDDPQKESPGCQAWWTSLAPARFTRAPAFREHRHRGLADGLFVCFRFEFLIRRSQLQILFLHNGRELVEIY